MGTTQKKTKLLLVLEFYNRKEPERSFLVDSFEYESLVEGWNLSAKLAVPLSRFPVEPHGIMSITIMERTAVRLLLVEQRGGFEGKLSDEGVTMEFTEAQASDAVFERREITVKP